MTRSSVTHSIPWIALFLLAFAGPPAILGADDVTPPGLAAFSFTPTSVDVSAGPAAVTVTAHITDSPSGFQWGYAEFFSPSRQQAIVSSFSSPPQSGTVNDGIYQVTATLPQFAEEGTWVLGDVLLKDTAGNYIILYTADLKARGFETALTVTSGQDVTPPALAEFSFSPGAVDTSAAPATVTLTARITDSPAGFQWGYAEFFSPSGQQWLTVRLGGPPQSGTVNDGIYQVTAALPRFAEEGTWVLGDVLLKDTAGNYIILYTADLAARGFPTELVNGPQTIQVAIDIKPGESPNSINMKSKGRIPVAMLSSATFFAPDLVDAATLTFGRTGTEPSLGFCNGGGEDVNGDGLRDLVCHFETSQTGFQPGDAVGWLKGQTFGGKPIAGSDSVRILK